MHRININVDPFDGPLFCPFCGTQSIDGQEDSNKDCEHLVNSDVGVDPDNSDFEATDEDICFVMFAPAPMSQEVFNIYRESGA
jgi:hypothetical protein